MILEETRLKGVCVIRPQTWTDDRGSFTRLWCRKEFEHQGLKVEWVQTNVSTNRRKGILRGLHYQKPPYPETKLVSCLRGVIFDVAVDLRVGSPTFGQWVSVTLEQNQAVLIPSGFAHGYQTLEDNVLIAYQMSEYYHPELAGGVRWNDPKLAISWPETPTIISERDRNLPTLSEQGSVFP